MNQVATFQSSSLPTMSTQDVEKVRELESAIALCPQTEFHTTHVIHAGMYHRTVMIPAGVVITGALIKIPTVLIVNGKVDVFTGEKVFHLEGHHVLAGQAGRKTAFLAYEDTYLTMCFTTEATTIEECEEQFTDEVDMLVTRKEKVCQE